MYSVYAVVRIFGCEDAFVRALRQCQIRFGTAKTSGNRLVGFVKNGRDVKRFYDNNCAAWAAALACIAEEHVGEHSALLYCAELLMHALRRCLHANTRASDPGPNKGAVGFVSLGKGRLWYQLKTTWESFFML
jgi:hypothetical protein